MKIWNSFGSDHSANLIMIGTFKDVGEAERAKELIDTMTEFMLQSETQDHHPDRFSDGELDLLGRVKLHSVGPLELEQFLYDVEVKLKDNQVIVTTEELEISAFLKIMIDKGARVEIFSRHDYPDPDRKD